MFVRGAMNVAIVNGPRGGGVVGFVSKCRGSLHIDYKSAMTAAVIKFL